MEDHYSDMVKRQQQELEKLAGTRYVDVEKLHQLGRPIEEINRLSKHYESLQQAMIAKHESEQESFFKPKEKEIKNEQSIVITDEAAQLLAKKQHSQDRGNNTNERESKEINKNSPNRADQLLAEARQKRQASERDIERNEKKNEPSIEKDMTDKSAQLLAEAKRKREELERSKNRGLDR